MFRHEFLRTREEGVNRLRTLIALTAHPHADRIGGGLLVTDNQNERNLLQAEVANLRVHLLVRGVEFNTQTRRLETLLHTLRIVEVLLRDRHEADLHRREP